MSSEINDFEFFEKCNTIWKKIEELMGINFERKSPFYNNTTYATKIQRIRKIIRALKSQGKK